MNDEPLLSVRDLKKHYPITKGMLKQEVGRVKAVDGISFDVRRGETVGLVGESGCGKSTAATSVLGLEQPTDGEVRFDGRSTSDFDRLDEKRFHRQTQLVFQDPDSSFDPRMSIAESVSEPLVVHGMRDRSKRRSIVADLLDRVGLSENDMDRYPHEFSGGQKQRIALARALATNPKLIVADEPVSALDVSIQADILSLMTDLQNEFGIGIVLISHNMSVIRQVCDRVNVMYLGEIVESGSATEVFENPQHPYTRALLSSVPQPDPRQRGSDIELTGDVPDPANPPSGCRFHTRCPEIIQPDGYDFEQEIWRAIMDFRNNLETSGIDVAAIRKLIVDSDDTVSKGSIADDRITRELRREFDLPEQLGDDAAEQVLTKAIQYVVDDEQDQARELLATEFESVCENNDPSFETTEDDHEASCHLLTESTENVTSPVND
jgi:peptide/nickel transport system ATP-binding protein